MKTHVKFIVFLVSLLCVSPLVALSIISRLVSNGESMFQANSQLLSLFPSKLGTWLRAAYYCSVCHAVNREVVVGFATLLSHQNTDIGQNVYIGPQSNIGSCSIGENCLLGSGVHVLSGKRQHNFEDISLPIRNQGGTIEKISIGKNSWIGNNALIMATIGQDSIVAAGAVVVDQIPARSIVAGNPARVIKSRGNSQAAE